MTTNSKPLVSIGLPVFSRPKQLEVVLHSLVTQTYPNKEIIVSDDCSPIFEIKKIVKKFQIKNDYIKYFRQKVNLGLIPNHHFVLRKAKGDYFFWASEDDKYEPSFIEILVQKLIDDSSLSISFCNYDNINSNGIVNQTYKKNWENIVESDNRLYRCMPFLWADIWETQKANFFHGIMRKDHAEKYPLIIKSTDIMDGNDIWFLFYSLIKGRIGFISQLLFHKGYDQIPHKPKPHRYHKLIEFNKNVSNHYFGLINISNKSKLDYISRQIINALIRYKLYSLKIYFIITYSFAFIQNSLNKIFKKIKRRFVIIGKN